MQAQNYAKVDKIVKKYSKRFSNADELSNKINKDFELPHEKARAIYTWITLNIKYDVDKLKSPFEQIAFSYDTQEEKLAKEREIFEGIANQTLKKRKAVCEGYSSLFKLLCEKSNLECIIISGSSKSSLNHIGEFPNKSNHAWNAIRINGEWKLIDVTRGAGTLNESSTKFIKEFNDFYFFTSAEKFFLNHYPDDKSFLFVDKSPEEFANLPYFHSPYFKWNIQLIEPLKGIIQISDNKKIKIVIRNPDKEDINLQFLNEMYAEEVLPQIENDLYSYEIEYKNTSSTYLTVFVNKTSVISFKIIEP